MTKSVNYFNINKDHLIILFRIHYFQFNSVKLHFVRLFCKNVTYCTCKQFLWKEKNRTKIYKGSTQDVHRMNALKPIQDIRSFKSDNKKSNTPILLVSVSGSVTDDYLDRRAQALCLQQETWQQITSLSQLNIYLQQLNSCVLRRSVSEFQSPKVCGLCFQIILKRECIYIRGVAISSGNYK